jgi:PAS domain S-box-containing protein
MKNLDLRLWFYHLIAFLCVAFAAQVAVVVADPRFGDHINQVAPVFGVAIGIVAVGGLRYLPVIFLGALLPAYDSTEGVLMILSVPLGTVAAAALSQRLLYKLHVGIHLERIRDALILIFCVLSISTCCGAIIESVFQCRGHAGIRWETFRPLFFTNWLAAGVGSIIITPFILAWADPSGFRLKGRQFLEIGVWLFILVSFGLVTFINWAPTDVLLYPMELAIFPVMAWSAIRFGLRGASAGVLVLAVTAIWALIPVFAEMSRISQSPANVWIFVGIVSITSICLAAVMTELRCRESQIAENESRLRAFTEALPDIAFVLSQDGLIIDVFATNSAVEANHRIAQSAHVLGRSLGTLFERDACESFLEVIVRALETNQVQRFEYSIQSAEGEQHWFAAHVSPMCSESGDSNQVVWVAYDISDRKHGEVMMRQREEELRIARDQANSASIAKGEFLAMMSHEIRTPMNAIIGYTDLMLETELDANQADHASVIKRSGNTLLNLINNILDYSKIEAHTLEFESEPFDIEQVVCEALGYVLPIANEKGLKVDYEIAPSIGEVYVGDAYRIRQILMNLASNAVKFTQEGSVRVSVGMHPIKSSDEADRVCFTVQDTGCGIASDQFDQLFKPFTQIGASTARQFGGTGLGLVICQRLVEQMRGEIWAENSEGRGARFQFMIPLVRPEPLAASTAAILADAPLQPVASNVLNADLAKAHPLSILVCEDDTDNRLVIKELLEFLGYEPQVAEDGEQAVERIQASVYDVVLMDVHLPGQSGIELTQAIRSGALENADTQQYIIAVTAFAMDEDREKCLAAGMNDYVSKPLEMSLLMDALVRAHTALVS